ncbi:ATP-binding protein [Candidatus Babeliales bacterium]|nr:ATP-binding protein [Candidatus Babeliales bacterium]
MSLSQKKQFFIFFVSLLVIQNLYSAQQAKTGGTSSSSSSSSSAQSPALTELARIQDVYVRSLRSLSREVNSVKDHAQDSLCLLNQSFSLAHSSNNTALDAHASATQTQEQLQGLLASMNTLGQELTAAQQAAHAVQEQINTFDATVEQAAQGIYDQVRQDAEKKYQDTVADKVHVAREKIREKQRRGIFKESEKMRAQATVDAEKVKWASIKDMMHDPKLIAKIVGGLTLFTLGFFVIKYGIPALIDYFSKPRVISETSETGWFVSSEPLDDCDLSDLLFTPGVQEQLYDLILRVDSARSFHENFPNVLLYGLPGTGKTAFVRALAHHLKLGYAFTSGSEFAKITDLSTANDELRKFIQWADDHEEGFIVFIDEADSLFANRKLLTTSKLTQDFINTFLALVQDGAQKNIMFIFATNHPFKLDDAIIDRIGISIEIELPGAPERALMLAMYLEKFAQANKDAVVDIQPEVRSKFAEYAQLMDGFSPRTIKFIAEEMIVVARRHNGKLINDIVCAIIERAQQSQQQVQEWEKQREVWINAQAA